MCTADPLVPMWAARSGTECQNRIPSRPVLIKVQGFGADLHGEIVTLTMTSARVRSREPFFLSQPVDVVVRFRFAEGNYELSGSTDAMSPDQSFTFDFDSVTRERMALLRRHLLECGYLQSSDSPAERPRPEARRNEPNFLRSPEALLEVQFSEPPNHHERRRQRRHELSAEATIQRVGKLGVHTCQLLEVSLGGCRIYTDLPHTFKLGEHVEVRFAGHGVPIRVAACIRFQSAEHVAGLEFIGMSSRTAARLQNLIRELSKSSFAHSPLESPHTEPSPQATLPGDL